VIPDDPTVPSSLGHSAHCRIFVADGSTGSGTLIARNDATGLVLTCAHLFDAATSNIIVAFPDGARYGGRLIDRDRANDLAAVLIGHPDVGPVSVDDDWRIELSAASMLTAGGYGGDGRFRPVRGPVSGTVQAVGATDPSVKITGTVRPGDSGGGVLDADGRLIGVVWGCRDGETYFTCGRPLRAFLDRVWRGRGREQQRPIDPSQFPDDWTAWRATVDAKVANIESLQNDTTARFEAIRDVLHTRIEERIKESFASAGGRFSELQPGLFGGLSYGKLAAGALGLSGPVALAVVVAGGLIGRRLKSRGSRVESQGPDRKADVRTVPIAVDTPPPPQRVVPETHFVPIEKDDFARAHQWASEHVARKYPGATEVLSTLDSLIKQQLAGSG
jgi:hypothetical protein